MRDFKGGAVGLNNRIGLRFSSFSLHGSLQAHKQVSKDLDQ